MRFNFEDLLSLFAMLCGTNRIAKMSSNCLHRLHPHPLTCIYGKSKLMQALFNRLSPYLAFAVMTCQLRGVPLCAWPAVTILEWHGVDPVTAKRDKFAARCELNLVRERNRRLHKCGMHVRNDKCGMHVWNGSFRLQNGMFQKCSCTIDNMVVHQNSTRVVVTCSTHFVYSFYTLG